MKYLIFSTLAAAQARSQKQAQAAGCAPPTVYWWDVLPNPDGRGAIAVDDSGAFAVNGLTATEQKSLVASLDATWTPPE